MKLVGSHAVAPAHPIGSTPRVSDTLALTQPALNNGKVLGRMRDVKWAAVGAGPSLTAWPFCSRVTEVLYRTRAAGKIWRDAYCGAVVKLLKDSRRLLRPTIDENRFWEIL